MPLSAIRNWNRRRRARRMAKRAALPALAVMTINRTGPRENPLTPAAA